MYGTAVWGNPKENEYVTSYMVLYSDNGQRYTYVTDADNSPAVSITTSLSLVIWKYVTFIKIILSSSIPFIIIVTLAMFIDTISLSYSLKKEVLRKTLVTILLFYSLLVRLAGMINV